jgi:hypothetical protein
MLETAFDPAFAARDKPAPADLPARPEDIDLDRVVEDAEYRRAVQTLLRRWGVCSKKPGGAH